MAQELASPPPKQLIVGANASNRALGGDEKAAVLLNNATPQEGLARLGVVLFNLNEFIYLE